MSAFLWLVKVLVGIVFLVVFGWFLMREPR
jgi:hypothetical protein